MPRRSYLVILNREFLEVIAGDHLSIERRMIPFEVEAGPLSACGELSQVLEGFDYRGQDLCLALDSNRVLSAKIHCGDLPRRQRRAAMEFRLEEYLPLEIEQVALAFIPPTGGHCLGLAVESQPLERLLDELAKRQIEVASICPIALLAIWPYLRQPAKSLRYVWLNRSGVIDLFVLSDSIPIGWSSSTSVERTLQSLHAHMSMQSAISEKKSALVISDVDLALPDPIEALLDVKSITVDDDGLSLALLVAATQRMAGKPVGWVDFRAGNLTRKNQWSRMGKLVNAAVVIGVSFLISLASLLLLRTSEFNAISNEYEAMQQQHYRLLYPDRQMPVNVKARLKSDLARLQGVSGLTGDMPSQPIALETLRNVMASLPAGEVTLRITHIQIGPRRVRLEGQARSHTDAEVISRHIQRAGLETDAPQSESLKDGGVSFTIEANLESVS